MKLISKCGIFKLFLTDFNRYLFKIKTIYQMINQIHIFDL